MARKATSSLRPLPVEAMAWIVGAAAPCSLGPNDLVKRLLMAHAER